MIELLLNYNIDTGEALLHAIDEEFVEGKTSLVHSIEIYLYFRLAVELLLHHEDLKQQQQQQQQQQKNNNDDDYKKVSRQSS